jgi:hypothetical protein
MAAAAEGVMPRGRGKWIAGVLLAALILGGAWYLWHTAQKVVPRDDAPKSVDGSNASTPAR